MKIKNTPMIT